MSLVLDGLISFACLSLSLLLFVTRDDDLAVPLSPSAYILFGSVTHARLLPQRSQHAFTYPMLTFLFSLSDLDAGKLSLLRGWLFSYNGKFFSVLGLRASNYLYRDHKEKSIRAKLVKTLERFGVSDAAELAGVWMMTMPRYLGWNATNALTVYYCYKKGEDKLWVAVFEVHNNFGERHVHVLQAGVNEEIPPKGFDHQWTVPRNFHASPTNDRSGAYTFALRAVPPPPSSTSPAPISAIKPVVLADFHDCPPGWTLGKDKGPLKLRVAYRTSRPAPLSTPALLRALAVYPFTLALVLPRTIYHALVLHYRRGVPIYRRPEMKPQWGDSVGAHSTLVHKSGGIAWQRPTRVEALAARLVLRFVARQADAMNIAVTLRAGDPATPTRTFVPAPAREGDSDPARALTISYLSPRLFTLLLAAPDAQSALARGGPQASRGGEVAEFVVSEAGLFAELFAVRGSAAPWGVGMLRWLRRLHPRAGLGLGQGEDVRGFLEPDSVAGLVRYLVVVGLCIAMEWVGWVVWGETGVKLVLDDTRT